MKIFQELDQMHPDGNHYLKLKTGLRLTEVPVFLKTL